MTIGEANRLVDLQYKVIIRSATGAEVETWTKLLSVWAKIQSLSGRKYIAAGGEQAEINSKITVRYRRDIKPSMRIVYGSRIFDIMAVLPDDKNVWMVLMCKEVN